MSQLITIRSNARKIMRRIAQYPGAIQRGAREGLERELLVTEDYVRTHTNVKWRSGGSGLSGRLTSYARLSGAMGLFGAIGFRKTKGFPYELAQEFGAKAQPGGAMAIPISGEARAVKGPRDMDDLVLIKGRKRAVLAQITPRGRMHVHFVLVKSIPARLNFRQSVAAREGRISDAIVDGANRGAMFQ